MDEIENVARRGGRGGIRTHGGFPHARFRVECLKPDSATLPRWSIVDGNLRRAIVRCSPSLQRQSITRALTGDSETWARDELACAREFHLLFSAAAAQRISPQH
jgi:hypothetical protein